MRLETTNASRDASGNLTSDGTNTYAWDARNHLASISGAASASFVYDAFGRRAEKTVNGTTTQFVYDGLNPVQELNGASPPVATADMLTGLNIDEYFQRSSSNGTFTYLTDMLGSTLALADSGGNLNTTYTYEPFGNTTISGTSGNPYQFTGRENDATGLYYYRARYYSPTLQRFASQDPIDFGGGSPNAYTYVGESPTSYLDPLGLWRLPDYISVNVNVAIPNPLTLTLVGWSGTVSLDRYGDWFWSPLGGGVGKSALLVSASVTGNWLDQRCTPSRNHLSNFLSSNGFNLAGGFWGGASESYTPGSGFATGIGAVTPQLGVSYNYSFYGGNLGFGW